MAVTTTERTDNLSRIVQGPAPADVMKHDVASATVIYKGDALYLSSTVFPASDLAWQTASSVSTYTMTVSAFNSKFIGIAMEPSASGSTDPILIAGDCVVEYDIDATPGAEVEAGGLAGLSYTQGSALKNQIIDEDVSTVSTYKCMWFNQPLRTTSTSAFVRCKTTLTP